ncbi:DNA topoisomerase 1 [Ascosphaera atra]|nr:DNA topoisomerase 1 [Ascosphaera atra]
MFSRAVVRPTVQAAGRAAAVSRPAPSAGFATLREIEGRLKSIKNIEKITNTMKIVASTRLNKATNAMAESRSYGQTANAVFKNAETKALDGKKTLYVVASSDKGLCGGVHSGLSKATRALLAEHHSGADAPAADLVVLGEKAKGQLARMAGDKIRMSFANVGKAVPTFTEAQAIADQITRLPEEYGSIKIIYNRFVNATAYEPTVIEAFSEESITQSPNISAFEIDEEALANLRQYALANNLYWALAEGHACEISARRNAMDNASKNAGDMIQRFQILYNRQRQAVITGELVEIITGASASEDIDMETGVSLSFKPANGQEDKEMRDALVHGNGHKRSPTRTSVSDSEDDKPLSKRRRTSATPKKSKSPTPKDESDSDVPVARKLSAIKTGIEKQQEQDARDIQKAEKEGKQQKPAAPRQRKKPSPKDEAKEESSDEDVPLAKKARTTKPKAAPKKTAAAIKADGAATAKKGRATKAKKEEKPEVKEEEEDMSAEQEADENRWWENPQQYDGTIKWRTLEHNGVVFPPEYEPLPSNVKLVYDGTPVNLHPEAEEVATFFGTMLNSTHNVENPTFQKNFFGDFRDILKRTGGAKDQNGNKVDIKDFKKCDFRPIFEHFESQRQARRNRSAAEKKQEREEKEKAEAPYMYCLWDGRKQKVGNFRVEPPALFRGRGEHPKTGKVKTRVMPEQITINIGKEAKVPEPPEGHHWKEVKHDQEGTWLAMWQENINGNYKYVMLAPNSDIKGWSDYKKFEKARELKKYIDGIRKDYQKKLKSDLMVERQKATAIYLIDKLALRAGNEKGEDEAETAGCCNLKFEHVSLKPPNIVVFDFLGKDSIRYYDEVEVDPQVFKNLKIFKKPPKGEGDDIFDRLNTASLNKHLSQYMPGLTAKVFRTFNASYTMATLLKGMKSEGTIPEKVKDYNDANRKVAILCNHKRTVTAGHAGQMEKLGERIKGMRYQKWRLKQMILALDPKQKKKRGAEWAALDADLTPEWLQEHQAFLVEEQRQKVQKKFERDNEKRAADGEKPLPKKELDERMGTVKELEKKFKKENKTGKVEPEGRGPTVEKFEAQLEKLEARIENATVQAEDKENNKEVALGTSRINYIDPRLTVVFSKKFGVPIEKFFSKTLREKFDWAMKSVDESWEF